MLVLLLACTGPAAEITPVADRVGGDNTPLATGCDPLDSARCWLPWPSYWATKVDATSPTGLRVDLLDEELPNGDDPRWLELADGFSPISPVATVFAGAGDLGTTEGAIRMFDAATGAEIPAWSELVVEGENTLILGYPADILPSGAEIVVVLTDAVRLEDGTAPPREDLDAVALGLVPPATNEEEALRAWHAPIRATLDGAGIDPESVVRAWSFPTRSEDDVERRLRSMLADVDASELTVTITSVETSTTASIAAVVYGEIEGVPDYRPDAEEWLNFGDDGLPEALGTHAPPFRIVVPAGDGDWRVVLYGHGTGGDVTDGAFDDEITAHGLGKAGMQFHGWNGDELIGSVTWFSHVFDASSRSTSALMQSVADGHALARVLDGALGDALAAETLGGSPNPVAGRRPLAENPMWVGGSLGGTMGAVMVAASDRIDTAVLNVPGAAWTHFIPGASLYTLLVDPITHAWYPNDIDRHAAIAMAQNAWDDVDGAAWSDDDCVLLLQESMDDPILPNVGTAMLARARGATMVGAPLDEMLDDLEQAQSLVQRTGITQYHTPYTGDYDIHGFADRDGAAGDAAREQIEHFLETALAGEAEILLPSGCDPDAGCDFR